MGSDSVAESVTPAGPTAELQALVADQATTRRQVGAWLLAEAAEGRMLPGRDAATPEQADEELLLWVLAVTGLRLARWAVCPGHDAPAQVFCDLYYQRVGVEAHCLIEGARKTGKTLLLALLHFVNGATRPGIETTHMGGTLDQAGKCYEYLQDMLGATGMAARRKTGDMTGEGVQRSIMRRTQWRSGADLTILAGSTAAASGPHPHLAVGDETEEWDQWQRVQRFKLQPLGRDGIEGQSIFCSTRYYTHGLWNRLREEAREQSNVRVYTWCIWDVMEPCAARGGCLRAACELWSVCQGKAEHADGHRTRESVVRDVQTLYGDPDTAAMQLFAEEGSREGLVFNTFLAQQWPEGNLAAFEPDPQRSVVGGADWGYRDDFCIELAQEDEGGVLRVFDEFYVNNLNDLDAKAEFVQWLRERWPGLWPQIVWWGWDRLDIIEQFDRQQRLEDEVLPPVRSETSPNPSAGTQQNKVAAGLAKMRGRILNVMKQRRLTVDPRRCPNLLQQLQKLTCKIADDGKPIRSKIEDGQQDHAADAARYLVGGVDQFGESLQDLYRSIEDASRTSEEQQQNQQQREQLRAERKRRREELGHEDDGAVPDVPASAGRELSLAELMATGRRRW
jgi:hypothetical protein